MSVFSDDSSGDAGTKPQRYQAGKEAEGFVQQSGNSERFRLRHRIENDSGHGVRILAEPRGDDVVSKASSLEELRLRGPRANGQSAHVGSAKLVVEAQGPVQHKCFARSVGGKMWRWLEGGGRGDVHDFSASLLDQRKYPSGELYGGAEVNFEQFQLLLCRERLDVAVEPESGVVYEGDFTRLGGLAQPTLKVIEGF